MGDRKKKSEGDQPQEVTEETPPAAEPETSPPPAHTEEQPSGVKVGDMEPGDHFTFEGHRFKVSSIGDEAANVILLETTRIHVGHRKYKTSEHGVARMEMDKELIVEKE